MPLTSRRSSLASTAAMTASGKMSVVLSSRSQRSRRSLASVPVHMIGFGTFMVMSACAAECDEAFVDPFTVRLPFTGRIADIKLTIVRASAETATPMPEEFAKEMKLVLGEELLQDCKRLRDYTVGDELDPTCPRGFSGVLFIMNRVVGAPLLGEQEEPRPGSTGSAKS